MSYVVYINWTRRRACWHRDGCGYIKMRGGDAEKARQEWMACATLDEVHRVLADKAAGFHSRDVAPCGRCRPDATE